MLGAALWLRYRAGAARARVPGVPPVPPLGCGLCCEACQGLTPKPHAPFDGMGPTSPNLKRQPGAGSAPWAPRAAPDPARAAAAGLGWAGAGSGVPGAPRSAPGAKRGQQEEPPRRCKNAVRSLLVLVLLPARMRAGNGLPLSIPGVQPAAQLPRAELRLAGQRLRQSPVSSSGGVFWGRGGAGLLCSILAAWAGSLPAGARSSSGE